MELTRKAWHTKNQLSKAQSDLEEVLSARSKTPASETGALLAKDVLIEEMQHKIALLETRLHQQEQEIHNQKIRIQQQADTITNQSQEIAKTSRPSHWDMPPAEFRLPSQYQDGPPPSMTFRPPIDYQAPTPVVSPPHDLGSRTRYGMLNELAYSRSTTTLRPSTALGDPFLLRDSRTPAPPSSVTSPHHGHRGVTDNGSPLPIERMGSLTFNSMGDSSKNDGSFSTPSRPFCRTVGSKHVTPNSSHSSGRHPCGQGLVAPAPLRAGTPLLTKQSPSLTSTPVPAPVSLIAKAYQDLLDDTLKFAYHYCNIPSTSYDGKLPQQIKKLLMDAGGMTIASRIMASQKSRYFLVAKVMLQWMSKHIILPEAFKEFNAGVYDDVQEQRRRIWSTTPDNVRYEILNNIAQQFQSLSTQPNWNKFKEFKINKTTQELHGVIVYLMYQGREGSEEGLRELVNQAHYISYMQLCSATEWRIHYPHVNEPFNANTMVNMDSEFEELTPQMVVERNGTVKLAALPQVLSRSSDGSGRVSSRVNIRAGVLLKFP